MGKRFSRERLLLLFLLLLLLLVLNFKAITASGYERGDSQSKNLPQDEVDVLNTIARKLRRGKSHKYRTDSCNETRDDDEPILGCDCPNNGMLCHVTSINFRSQNEMGQIPLEIANLQFLRKLDLSYNRLHDGIPASLTNLSQLTEMYLQYKMLDGPIPAFLGSMKSLEILHLRQNFFSGLIPAELGALPSLYKLSLSRNNLSGPIPYELGNITTLRFLYLYENRLSGDLPERLGNLTNLQILNIMHNEFSGGFPASFDRLSRLQYLGAIGNNFSGRIPNYIWNWKHLKSLTLIGNNFEGPLPDGISNLTNLAILYVSDLIRSGGGGGFAFPELSNMKSLERLILRNYSITGSIPGYIGELSSIVYLDLSFNQLTGEVPNSISHLHLYTIFLTSNKLTGSIPSWGTNSAIMNADFSNNNFTNVSFVESYNNSKNVNLFACCSPTTTNLTFPLQNTDFSCADNKKMNDNLYINCGGDAMQINESWYEADWERHAYYVSPKKNWAYSSTGDFLTSDGGPIDHIQNRTCGISMPDAALYMTARLSPLSLKYYGLCLNNGNYTVKLYFAEIIFSDRKDYSIKGRRIFDVFIQGNKVLHNFNIKEEASGPNKKVVKDFNVSVTNNCLEIHFYWAGKGSMEIHPELYGPLISAISVTVVPKASGKLPGISIAAIAGSALLFFVLVLVFFWKMGWLGGKEMRDEELKDLELFPGGLFNFRQIKAATQNFSVANKIGEGGFGPVYKGVLPNGMEIAVKQLSSKSGQGIREFVNEVGTISALQHPNLVRLLRCSVEHNQLLLVYEYMENNTLARALHGSEELRMRLNWPMRVKICLGIAKGLAFLHEETKLKIVHRDIKPTNILLDKDFNAKISDFGFAKLYEEDDSQIITRIAGTTGYMAPEYALRGHLTSKADVYSFGIVILEIMSGKNSLNYRPNEESVYLLDLAYVLQEKGNLLNLVDSILASNYSLKEAKMMLDLAMVCTNPSPTLRPAMSEVVSILEGKTKMKVPSLRARALHSTYDFTGAKAMADDLSLSTLFGSTSTEGTSNTFSSHIVSKEGECNISENYPPEISDETERSLKKTS